jgi:pimeloyl-ACP methyl ester carboxylesterase
MGDPGPVELAPPIPATRADLPAAVAAALDRALEAPAAETRTVPAAGLEWFARTWGDEAATPLLLLHGVTSSSAGWWRVGPALAAAGFRVVAPDHAGHGRTGHWTGHHRFVDNARDLAAFARAAGLATPELHLVGHSWGAMTAAWLPAAGLVPARIVLVDPPAIPRAAIATMLDDPVEHRYDDLDVALPAIAAANPGWAAPDVHAKAEALTLYDEEAVRSVLLDNGDWDGGLAGLAEPAARDVPVWLVRGEPEAGGLVPEPGLGPLARRIGVERVLTIDGGSHSPHRVRPEATVLALLLALGRPDGTRREDAPGLRDSHS